MSYVNNYLLLLDDYETEEREGDSDVIPAIERLNATLPEGRRFKEIGHAYDGWKSLEAEVFASSAGINPDEMCRLIKAAHFSERVQLLVREQDMLTWQSYGIDSEPAVR